MFHSFLRAAALSAAFLATSAHGGTVVLNEVMASNSATITDAAGTYADWIEIYNDSTDAVQLGGYGLTDTPSNPFQWVFPAVSIAPGEFLLVWASGKDSTDPVGALHTNFKISSDGETIVLTRPDGTLQDSLPRAAMGKDVSWGRTPDGGADLVFFAAATPGRSNAGGGQAVLEPPAFSHSGGFYPAPFDLSISSSDAQATIRYTVDGSEPTETSPVYSGALRIEDRTGPASGILLIRTTNPQNVWHAPTGNVFRGTPVRARAFKTGCLPSKTVTGTYFVTPKGRARYPFPVLSLVTDSLNLFDDTIGIYVPGSKYAQTGLKEDANFYQSGGDWERPVHVELMEEDGTLAFSQGAGMRIHGNYTRDYFQKPFRLYAKSSYGKDWFETRLFPESDITRFKRILVRTGASDIYTALIRDGVMQSLVSHLSFDTQKYRPVVVFFNGDYWGIQFFRDRYDEYYLQTHHGADPSAVDLIEIDYSLPGGPYDADPGDAVAFTDMLSYTKNHSATDPQVYEHFKTLVDVENFAEYCAANIFVANTDWPHKNVRVWRARVPYSPSAGQLDGRWRWLAYDFDRGFGLRESSQADQNTLIWATIGNPNQESTWLLRWLLLNPDFRTMFINTLADQLNSTFTEPRMIGMIDSLAAQIAPGMPEHIARWGEPKYLYYWTAYVQTLRNFATARRPHMIQHILGYFRTYTADTAAVTINTDGPAQNCGTVRINSITIEDGFPGVSHPVYPWRGVYFRDIPVRLVATPKPGYVFAGWETAAGIISLSDTLTLSLTTDTTVTAKFTNPADVAAPPSSRAFYLDQNTPNPFNPSTTLRFGLPDAGYVTLAVYDVNGRQVRNLVGRTFLSGHHEAVWDGCDNNGRAVASGVYLVRLTVREGVLTRRVTLLR